jgi:hypothetical protein
MGKLKANIFFQQTQYLPSPLKNPDPEQPWSDPRTTEQALVNLKKNEIDDKNPR